jgi:hypothetical protein
VSAGHLARSKGLIAQLLALLRQAQALGGGGGSGGGGGVGQGRGGAGALAAAVKLKARAVAEALSARRAYVSGDTYDPSLLVFEFSANMVLRPSQVKLIRKFVGAHARGESLCHQLIMGAGKTTVIAPVLALLLARRDSALFQVVPQALIEMTRSVLREKFSSLLQKPVYTFAFDRSDNADSALLAKLEKARHAKAIILASPTSIKSFLLKFVEMVHMLDQHESAGRADAGGAGPGGAGGGGGLFGFILGNKRFASSEQEVSCAAPA